MPELSPTQKVYSAEGEMLSILDLLGRFSDSEIEVDGISRCSDLHLKVEEPVRYRYDSELESIVGGVALDENTIKQLVFPLLSEKHRNYLMESHSNVVDAGYYWQAEKVNFRLNAFYDRDGLACVIRMLPKEIPEIDQLGFPRESVWQDLVSLKQGLVLVTGVTGSGKSTTIASILDYINKTRKVRIITLEDPVEHIFRSEQSLISQRELDTHISSFAEGLRSALREDPDIIYLGEIRDIKTAALALSAAETGHLVFTTMHTKDVVGIFGRFVDMFPLDRSNEIATQLSFALSYIISQKLLLRSSGQGRIPAFEVMKNIASTKHMIRSGKYHQIPGSMETGAAHGMNTLEQHLVDLVDAGEISREEAINYANDSSIEGRLH